MLNCFSHVLLFATLSAIACQAPLSLGFSSQEYWSGLPCSPPGDFPNPGIQPAFLRSPALAGEFFTTSVTWEAGSRDELINRKGLVSHGTQEKSSLRDKVGWVGENVLVLTLEEEAWGTFPRTGGGGGRLSMARFSSWQLSDMSPAAILVWVHVFQTRLWFWPGF